MMPLPQEVTNDVDEILDLLSNGILLEVFVYYSIALTDDFTQAQLLQVSREMLHGINTVFPPPEVTGHNGGDPISENKVSNHNRLWDHIKEILIWIIDGANFKICLPPKRVDTSSQLSNPSAK